MTDKEIILLDALRKLEAMASEAVEIFDPDNHPDDYVEIWETRKVLSEVLNCEESSFLGRRIPHRPSSLYRRDWIPVWWCEVHDRRATEKDNRGGYQCDSKLGGIMMPCKSHQIAGQIL